jgi:hypothetical protein
MSTELTWNDEGRTRIAQVGNVTYFIISAGDGNATFLNVRDPRSFTRHLNLGNFNTVEEAKRKCERHYADGCDVSAAERF